MTTYKEIDEKLDRIIAEIGEIKQCQAVERTMIETLAKLVEKHERVLFGGNGDGGMILETKNNQSAIANAQKVLWIVVTPFLTAIGVGIVYIIVATGF